MFGGAQVAYRIFTKTRPRSRLPRIKEEKRGPGYRGRKSRYHLASLPARLASILDCSSWFIKLSRFQDFGFGGINSNQQVVLLQVGFSLSQILDRLPIVRGLQFDANGLPLVHHRAVALRADTHEGCEHDLARIRP